MLQLNVTTTKDYVILKIPRALWPEREYDHGPIIKVPEEEKKLIVQGIQDIEEGRVSKTFKSAKSAITFLRSL